MKGGVWVYLVALVLAEVAGVAVSPGLGAALHAALFVALIVHYVWKPDAPYRRMLPVLALLPLTRILSLALPSPELPSIYWYALVGVPVLIAAVLAARRLSFTPATLGLRGRFGAVQGLIALSGLPLGAAAYLILRPAPLVAGDDWLAMAFGSLSLAVFAGLTEELIFRGLFLHTTREVFGRTAAIVWSALLFAAMYVGSLSLGFVLLTGAVGLFFAYCVDRTGSLWGVIGAHSLMAIGLIIIWPVVAAGLS